jgi:hypothetical protein
VVREASFARTVVVHDVAKTQRALLHSILPGLHSSGSHTRRRPRLVAPGHRTSPGALSFRIRRDPDTEGKS